MMTRLRPVAVAPIVACAVGLGTVGIAQASDTSLRTTVKSAVPTIQHSQAKVLDGLAAYEKTHSSGKLIRAIDAQDRTLRSLKAKLSSDSASTASGRTGRKDIIAGLGLIVDSNQALAKDLAKSGQTSKSALQKIVARGKRGNLELERGAKLLKV